jgi:PKD repeat protein
MGRRFLLPALALMLTLSASPALAKTVDVEVGQTGDTFTDANVSINPGDSVHWNWDATDHSVTSGSPPGTPDGGFDSRVQSSLPASFDQTFNHPGVYHYFCRIHYLFGMVGTITVTGTDPAPTASFTASSLTPVQRASVQFDASGSSTGDGDTIDSYSWEFGDGTLPQTSTTPEITHAFTATGVHTVKLTITDSGSATDSTSQQVNVQLPPETGPTAGFTLSPAAALVGGPVHFDASGSGDRDGDKILSYHWDFGDGSILTTPRATISHPYARPGTKTVELVVSDSRGVLSKPTSHTLTVRIPPPRLTQLRVSACLKHDKRCKKPGIRASFSLSAARRVTLSVTRKGRKQVLRRVSVAGRRGTNAAKLDVRGLASGRYVLNAAPAGGNAVTLGFQLR